MQNLHLSTPKERLSADRNDCAVIAMSNATGLPYAICLQHARAAGRRDKHGTISHEYIRHVKSRGIPFRRIEMPKWALTTLGLAFVFPSGSYYVCTKSHAFALVDGKILDNGGLKRGRIQLIRDVYIFEGKRSSGDILADIFGD